MQPKRVVKTKVLWLEWRGAVTLYCEVERRGFPMTTGNLVGSASFEVSCDK